MVDSGSPHDDGGAPRGDLRAPTQEVWEALSPGEKERWHDRLLVIATAEWEARSEGDWQRGAKTEAEQTRSAFFRRTRRDIYVASDLMVVYPGERPFVSDLIAVRDVEPRRRRSWIVAEEKPASTSSWRSTTRGTGARTTRRTSGATPRSASPSTSSGRRHAAG